jgi:hypothetical protein
VLRIVTSIRLRGHRDNEKSPDDDCKRNDDQRAESRNAKRLQEFFDFSFRAHRLSALLLFVDAKSIR